MQFLRAPGGIACAGLLASAMLTFVAPSVPATSVVVLKNKPTVVASGKLELDVEDWNQVAAAWDKKKEMLTEYLASKYSRPKEKVARIVKASYIEAERNGLNPLLVLAVIEKESSLKPHASSDYGALGLMQVVPAFHADKLKTVTHPDGLFNPEANIHVGTKILAEYSARYSGDMDRALKRYSGSARDYSQMVGRYKTELEQVISASFMKARDRKVPV